MSCVLTLALDPVSQERFEALRQHWFPPERNQIPAHLTLFHTLPEGPETEAQLGRVAAEQRTFALRVSSVRSIGRGVAYFLESAPALGLHRQLRDAFAEHLSAQDRQGFRPHVVVQNKAEPDAAKIALVTLQASFTPWTCMATGLDLWRYLGGPWKHLHRFNFSNAAE